ncbi:diacylglycerol/lipid kinase family protein [Paradesertivirga mongoliensis]|uniref:Diacylglycerol/lipid kinase family protein n=1 Tax=Paradesertivirga mongoliensis TaxID=2100740 RepID=A0ABW4ZJS9_9SPHI|nr:diacylglycerol kinase family protein [Pedobacter mongoliensis]
MKKSVLFIINPISGGKKKLEFPAFATMHLDLDRFNADFVYTEWPTHANDLAIEAVENGMDIVVSVGGDGTINEVASALEGTDTIMGIIPFGSGNGLARSLNISLSNKKAVQILNNLHCRRIDSGILNERKFFNMAGMGFDAHISAKFAQLKNRGLKGYVHTALKEVSAYVPENYDLEIDGNHYEREAFMISIANSCQYGNNAYISPDAKLDDGLLDVCIIKPFPLVQFPVVGYHLFNKTVHTTSYVEIIKGKNIRINRKQGGMVHVDGEPIEMDKCIEIKVKPLSLAILN